MLGKTGLLAIHINKNSIINDFIDAFEKKIT